MKPKLICWLAAFSSAVMAGCSTLPQNPESTPGKGALADARLSGPALKFSFGAANMAGYTQITPDMTYSSQSAFGFEPGAVVGAVQGGPGSAVTSDHPFYFSAAEPEGNYRVTVKLGNPNAASETTVQAELRRLMLEKIQTQPGQFKTLSFIVNVRQPVISTGGQVRLKDREKTSEARAWDDRLTLAFLGVHPSVASIVIQKIDVPTLFIIGDSTVCDQPSEPYNSWGQMLPRFIKPDIAVANHAESGETVAACLGEQRFNKIWSLMKTNDYLVIQFGHNDMKSTAPNALETYAEDLRKVVDKARSLGGIPILCTPVSRRSFDQAGVKVVNSFRGYPDAVRQVAKEKEVPLIDLQQMGATFYEALGPEAAHKAFATASEATHHDDYGSYEIAKCVLQGIEQIHLPLAQFISADFKGFDPAHPDAPDSLKFPSSTRNTSEVPLGN